MRASSDSVPTEGRVSVRQARSLAQPLPSEVESYIRRTGALRLDLNTTDGDASVASAEALANAFESVALENLDGYTLNG